MTVPTIQLQSTTINGVKYKPTLFNKPIQSHTDNNNNVIYPVALIKSERLVNNITTTIQCITFDNKTNRIALSNNRGTIYIIDIKQNTYYILVRSGIQINTINFLLYNTILCGCNDGSMRIYNIDNGDLICTLKGHNQSIHHVDICNKYIITCSIDCSILWSNFNNNIIDNNIIRKLKTLNINVKYTHFSQDEQLLYTLIDNTIHVWHIDNMTELYTLSVTFQQQQGFNYDLTQFVITENNELCIAIGNNNVLYVFSLSTKLLLHTISLPVTIFSIKQINTIKYTALYIILLCSNGSIAIIEPYNKTIEFILQSQPNSYNIYMSLSYDLQYIATITQKHNLRLYYCNNILTKLKHHYNTIQSKYNLKQQQHEPITPIKQYNNNIQYDLTSSPLISPNNNNSLFDIIKLRKLLLRYGEFPVKYRILIYRYLLNLPENTTSYHILLQQGLHHSVEYLYEKYPIKSNRLYRNLQVIISNFIYYNQFFEICNELPIIIFPFIKSLTTTTTNQSLSYQTEILFELILTFMYNISINWFILYPNGPISICNVLDQCLQLHDTELYIYLHNTLQLNTIDIYYYICYSLLQNYMNQSNWLILLDYLFTDEPILYYYIIIATIIYNRIIILDCKNKLEYNNNFIHNTTIQINIHKLIQDTYIIRNNTNTIIHNLLLKHCVNSNNTWLTLNKQQYNIIDFTPKFIVDYQLKQHHIIQQQNK